MLCFFFAAMQDLESSYCFVGVGQSGAVLRPNLKKVGRYNG